MFQSILENAVRLCDAKFGMLYLFDGKLWYVVAELAVPTPLTQFHRERGSFLPDPATPLGQLFKTKEIVLTADQSLLANPSPSGRLGGARSHLVVPMLKQDNLVGAVAIYRQVVQPFADKQIALVQNFAAQAVIAIENARLLNELKQRTADLSESLEQQTATSEVLTVISSSSGALKPVFQAILANATRISSADYGTLSLCEGDGSAS